MTEHDGLTAEQEAKRRWPTAAPWTPTPAQGQNAMHFAFVSGAVWATERDLARAETYHAAYREALASAEQANLRASKAGERAEAAEARVDQLMQAIIWMSGSDDFGPGKPAHDHWVEIRDTLLFPPNTEAVTEVEGS